MPDTGRGMSLVDRVEARAIKAALTTTEHVLRGRRYHLFLLAAGTGRLVSDDGENLLAAPCILWLPHGLPRSFRLEAGTRGGALAIPDPQLGRAMPSGSTGTHIREVIGYPLVVRDPDQAGFRRLAELIETMGRELYENAAAADSVVQHSLALALIELWRLSRPEIAAPGPLPRNVVHTFLSLVDLHLRDQWTVQRYARQIGVSRDRLNTAVRRATGRSPLAHIHNRMMAEARALLTGSSLQVAEVAYKLGFGDAAYFSRFFQRNAGVPPGRYRKAAQVPAEAPDGSFAAWP